MSDIRPDVDALGVPLCSDEKCPAYDGKRCRVLGFRPSRVCEPGVQDLAAKYTLARNAQDNATAEFISSAGQPALARLMRRKRELEAVLLNLVVATEKLGRGEVAGDVAEAAVADARVALESTNEPRVRGVDFPCEDCGALKGSSLDNGWFRCTNCGYPGQ